MSKVDYMLAKFPFLKQEKGDDSCIILHFLILVCPYSIL